MEVYERKYLEGVFPLFGGLREEKESSPQIR